jgi:serine/threonine protein phosphatase 1
LAWRLRKQLTAMVPPGGWEEEIGLRTPIVQIKETASALARRTGAVLAVVGAGLASLLHLRGRPETKPATVRHRPPAQIPSGRRVYAVGDIHGRADLLIRLMQDLREDTARGEYLGRPILIFLGDYIDRGFQSKEVIDFLLSDIVSPFETYFLKGNHEAAMIQFLSDPSIGPRWAEYGGAETLVSYGVQPPRTRTSMDEWKQASASLNAALPPQHFDFLSRLDLSVRVGDYLFVHAGVRPAVPLDMQTEQDLLWIREEFLGDRRELDAVIVHGHTPERKPYRDARRIGLDTGAYLSGRLTAARFEHDNVEFIVTEPRVAVAHGVQG